MEKVYIFGHKNPDTDAVCGSIALSYLKNKLGMNSEPRILSPINPETVFALKKFNVEVPKYLNDVKVQIKDVNFNKNHIINEDKPVIEAFRYMNNNEITGLPLVDDEKKFKGYISLKEILADMVDNDALKIDTSFTNLVSTLEATDYLKFDEQIKGSIYLSWQEEKLENLALNKNSILLLTNENLIQEAILKDVKLIILGECSLSSKLKKEMQDRCINMIATNKNILKIARILGLANPIKSIKRPMEIITFNSMDYLTDFNDETSRLKHTNYPIVNNNNICIGMLRTIDTHEINRKKVILVDHNMVSQSVDGLYEADILEIIDHHNIGDINTSSPINFRTMAVGAVNTIIYYLFKENNIKIPAQIAGIMLSGIISDTLLLQSPTTTFKDKLVADDLAKIAGIDMKKYGLQLLESGIAIDGLSANEIILKDCKTYKVGESSMAIAQVFTTDIEIFRPRFAELIEELNRLEANHEYKVCALFITNFFTNNSYLLYSDNSKKTLEIAYMIDELEEGQMLKNIVSRKKQMVPNIMDVLERG